MSIDHQRHIDQMVLLLPVPLKANGSKNAACLVPEQIQKVQISSSGSYRCFAFFVFCFLSANQCSPVYFLHCENWDFLKLFNPCVSLHHVRSFLKELTEGKTSITVTFFEVTPMRLLSEFISFLARMARKQASAKATIECFTN